MLFFAIILVQNVGHNSMAGWAGLGSRCMMLLFTQNIADHLPRILCLEPSTMGHIIMLVMECPQKEHTLKMKSTIFCTCHTTQ
jgi:hypothetical protein